MATTLALSALSALAQEGSPGATAQVTVITPVFGQLVGYRYPAGFGPAFESNLGEHYLQESVLKGETVARWTQMLTLTGFKGLAGNPNATPSRLAGQIAAGFRAACPESYSALQLSRQPIGGREAFVGVVRCGAVTSGGEPRSESTLLIVLKGEQDYLTLQWAERGAPSDKAEPPDRAMWSSRLAALMPMRLCSIVPDEAAPYPSCLAQP